MANNQTIDYPDTDEIDQEYAKFLFEHHCAILVIEDLPPASEFGIDLVTFRTGQMFKGVKLIPPGVHLVYASAVESKGDERRQCGPRCGFFHYFRPREILIKRWSIEEEDFDDSFESDESYSLRYRSNLYDLDRFLGAYRFSTFKTYMGLTNKITPELMSLLVPDCKRIRAVPYLTRCDAPAECNGKQRRIKRASLNTDEPATSKPSEDNLLPDLKPEQSTMMHFSSIPCDHIESSQEIRPNLITQYNLDTTMKLEHTFPGEAGRSRLLGEFQFAFITLVYCHVYDCLEQWKSILGLVCKADEGICKYPEFYLEFLVIVRWQLEQIPEDLFVDLVDANNLVRCNLDLLLQNIASQHRIPEEVHLDNEATRLKRLAESKFGWEFNLELEDEQPVIVEL